MPGSLLAKMIYVLIDVCLAKPLFIASAEVDSQLCLQIQEAKANQSIMLCILVSVMPMYICCILSYG